MISVGDIAQLSGTAKNGNAAEWEENSGRRKRLRIPNLQSRYSKFEILGSKPMNIPFFILSGGYITGLFLFTDSPVVSKVALFNPFSLLHIPLYGILTLLLILSFSPDKLDPTKRGDSIKHRKERNPTSPRNSRSHLIAGLIALVVAVVDEIHQAYIPSRNASVSDVLLDVVGIICCILIIKRIEPIPKMSKVIGFFQRMI